MARRAGRKQARSPAAASITLRKANLKSRIMVGRHKFPQAAIRSSMTRPSNKCTVRSVCSAKRSSWVTWVIVCGPCRLTDDAALQTSRRYFHRVLGELPHGQNGTQNESDIKHAFDNVTAFLFRAHQEGISRFELVIHKICSVNAISLCNCRARRLIIDLGASSPLEYGRKRLL